MHQYARTWICAHTCDCARAHVFVSVYLWGTPWRLSQDREALEWGMGPGVGLECRQETCPLVHLKTTFVDRPFPS